MTNQNTFIRSKHDKQNPYTIISREMFHDPDLSLAAKGLLGYFLTLPDDWKINHSHLQKALKTGRYALDSALHELIEKGYAKRELKREGGRFQAYQYEISESKIFLPLQENRSGFPAAENQQLLSNDKTKEIKTNKEKIYKKEIPIEEKKPFGPHVKLKEADYEKICSDLGKEKIDSIIEDINNYLDSSGRKPYSCYLAAIRTFLKKEKKSEKPKSLEELNKEVVNKFFKQFPATSHIEVFNDFVRNKRTDKEIYFKNHTKERFIELFKFLINNK